MRNLFQNKITSWVIGWIVLSLLLIICVTAFRINGYILSPQHGHFDNFEAVNDIIFSQNEEKIWLYHVYFILDPFWGFCLLAIIFHLISDLFKDPFLRCGDAVLTVKCAFFAFAGVALVADVWVALGYEFRWVRDLLPLSEVEMAKNGLYVICLLFLVYWLLKTILLPNIKNIIRFVQTSLLSLLFIAIIYVMVTFMDQGGTLIVDLFYGFWNIIILFFLLTFLALLLSHFPVYVDIWLYGNSNQVSLKMSERHMPILGFNIIYYDTEKNKVEKTGGFNNEMVKNLRRSLGILVYIAVFQIFLMMLSRYFEVHFNTAAISVFLLIITLIIFYKFGKRYNRWKKVLSGTDSKQQEKMVEQIIKYTRWFPMYFIFCVAMVIFTAVMVGIYGWNRYAVILVLITLVCQMYLYLYFKICRSYLKYVFFSEKLKERNPEMFKRNLLILFDKFGGVGKTNCKCFRVFGSLSDNISYLNLMRVGGLISLVCLLFANVSFDVATFFNPINIILLYIIVIYSLLILLFKHLVYYHWLEEKVKGRNFFRYWVPLLLILMVGGGIYSISLNNDLHELQEVPTQSPVGFKEFLDGATENSSQRRNYFFVGSYGGGLKANLWNLLLLKNLDSLSSGEFFNRSIVMSGVSGGAVGIGNFASLLNNSDPKKNLNDEIFKIGVSNVLSNEITYLFGRDWLREYFPSFEYHGKDRSYKSMKLHAKNTGMSFCDFENKSYLDEWRELYQKRGRKFPALIMNSTSVAGRQGVVSTVMFPDSTFAGADNLSILKHGNDTLALTFYGAVSTTNRFPLFSPTAKIKEKGNYLDGGYFENSGLLSAVEVYDAIERDDDYKSKVQPIFINIVNSGDFYIKQKLLEWGFKPKSIKESGEVASIIGTVVSIEKLPGYIYEKIENRGFAVVPIMMPHKLSYERVKDVLKADVDDPLALIACIEDHNLFIDQALKLYRNYDFEKWGVVEPPLARLLSIPAVRYQEAMVLYHPEVIATLNQVKGLIDTDFMVTNVNQNQFHREKSKYFDETKSIQIDSTKTLDSDGRK